MRVSEELTPELTAPPAPQEGVCSTCRTWSDTGTSRCSNCAQNQEVLGQAPLPLTVVSLYRKPSPLREWLTRYKPSSDGTEPAVPEHTERVQAILARFLLEHGPALVGRLGGVDALVVVPSTTPRLGSHPLGALVEGLNLPVPLVTLLRRGPGDLGFCQPARDGYETAPVPGRGAADSEGAGGASVLRVLLVDDVYTTGARANSAAYALRAAGHQVAGLLVLARRVNPDYDERADALWQRQREAGFDWARSPVLAS